MLENRSFWETKDACEIAGLPHKRLNEIVSLGHYKCAPKTESGVPRHFDLDDVVCLKAYVSLVKFGITSKVAGLVCCLAREGSGPTTSAAYIYLNDQDEPSLKIVDQDGSEAFYGLTTDHNPNKATTALVINFDVARQQITVDD